jgi:hypothetical protein
MRSCWADWRKSAGGHHVEIRHAEIRDFDLRGLSKRIDVPCRKISVSSSLKHPG